MVVGSNPAAPTNSLDVHGEMRAPAPPALLLVVLAFAGCQSFQTVPRAAEICALQAPVYSGVVVGAFDTTVGAVRRLQPREVQPPLWEGIPDAQPAVACYIDALIAKAPPGAAPYDRALIGVVDGAGRLVVAGYRDQMPVFAP